jgi:hypothetical protein
LKSSLQGCNHSQPITAEGHHTDLTFDQTIQLLRNQDITMTMIEELQPNNIALFNNKTTAQDGPSDYFIQQYKPKESSKQQQCCKTKSQHIRHSKIECNNCGRLGHYSNQ